MFYAFRCHSPFLKIVNRPVQSLPINLQFRQNRLTINEMVNFLEQFIFVDGRGLLTWKRGTGKYSTYARYDRPDILKYRDTSQPPRLSINLQRSFA